MVLRLSLRSALAVACLVGAAACAVAYRANVRLQDALESSLGSTDYARALRDVRRSGSSLNPTAYREGATALALLQLRRPVEAEKVAARVVRREPLNAQTWVLLARVQVTRGRLRTARYSWARARRLDPHLRGAVPNPVGLIPRQ